MKFEIDRRYIDEGLITEREHPTEPYLIYNYTPACQYSKAWDEVTTQCRGLIVHRDTREVIARPFPKFFNYEEHVEKGLPIPDEKPIVYDKRDGSLGILYWGQDGKTPYIATRGSFTSDQAIWATEWLRSNAEYVDLLEEFEQGFTYLFEIIYPENRIVVDYGTYRGLDLLAVIHTETGKTTPNAHNSTPIGKVVYPIQFTSFEDLKALNEKNKEGFVLHYQGSNLRLKIKFEDYVRLHKVMTGLSEIGIWEMLRDGKSFEEILGDVPDEMHGWLKEVVERMLAEYKYYENDSILAFTLVRGMQSRKEQAEAIKREKNPSIVFAMLDGKDYSKIIWRMVRPHGSSTFRKDIDA